MIVNIDEINGKKVTVIRQHFDPQHVESQLAMNNTVLAEYTNYEGNVYLTTIYDYHKDNGDFPYRTLHHGFTDGMNESMVNYLITILPPLPRYPTLKDVKLLHRYISEGLEPCAIIHNNPNGHRLVQGEIIPFFVRSSDNHNMEIVYCIDPDKDPDNNKVEVAIHD